MPFERVGPFHTEKIASNGLFHLRVAALEPALLGDSKSLKRGDAPPECCLALAFFFALLEIARQMSLFNLKGRYPSSDALGRRVEIGPS